MRGAGPDVLVLGVGNILWADEGFGVRCVEQFVDRYTPEPGVEAMDGGTQGLSLINILSEARRVILFDAVDIGGEPGALITVRGADVPTFVAGKKVSLHQTSMMEVLALAELMGGAPPEDITLIGCQPIELEDYGGGLTPGVAKRVGEAVEVAAQELAAWGHGVRPKSAAERAESVMPEAVAWRPYEDERPSADAACRIGDERVLERAARRAT